MKQALISAIVAAIVSVGIIAGDELLDTDEEAPPVSPVANEPRPANAALPSLRLTEQIAEDTWVNGSRGSGSDRRSLADASTSICYLTKVEIKGVQSPEDSNACEIRIDEFLGYWELVATVVEGGQSEVRCNARCLTWE